MTVRVIHGDALEAMRALAAEGVTVDAVVTDPPFFLPAKHYAARGEATVRKAWARSLADLSILEHYFADVFRAIRSVLKPGGHVLSFCDGQSYPVFYCQAYRLWPNVGALIWQKRGIGFGSPWRYSHELIMFACDRRAQLQRTCGTVFECAVVPSGDREHPAEKPVPLIRDLLTAVLPSGGTVLDPYAGSGTVGGAAKLDGFNAILIEREAEYIADIHARLERARAVAPLFAAAE